MANEDEYTKHVIRIPGYSPIIVRFFKLKLVISKSKSIYRKMNMYRLQSKPDLVIFVSFLNQSASLLI